MHFSLYCTPDPSPTSTARDASCGRCRNGHLFSTFLFVLKSQRLEMLLLWVRIRSRVRLGYGENYWYGCGYGHVYDYDYGYGHGSNLHIFYRYIPWLICFRSHLRPTLSPGCCSMLVTGCWLTRHRPSMPMANVSHSRTTPESVPTQRRLSGRSGIPCTNTHAAAQQ